MGFCMIIKADLIVIIYFILFRLLATVTRESSVIYSIDVQVEYICEQFYNASI